jgi:hypothetical protein
MTLANQKSTGPTIEPPHDARGYSIDAILDMDLNVTSCPGFWREAQIYAYGTSEGMARAILAIPQAYLRHYRRIYLDFGEHRASGFFNQECEPPITNEEITALDSERHIKGLRRVTSYLSRAAHPDLVIKFLWGCTLIHREGNKNSYSCFQVLDRHFCEAGYTLNEYRQFKREFYNYKFGPNIHLLTQAN